MGRPPNPERREELLGAAIEYLADNGLGNLSIRALATELGVTAPTLLYHFESKEQLVIEVLDAIETEELSTVTIDDGDASTKHDRYWKERTGPRDLARTRLQLEAICLSATESALPAPVKARIVTRWIDTIRVGLVNAGVGKEVAESYATLVHAAGVGLLVDLIATNNRTRVEGARRAMHKLLVALETQGSSP